MSTPRKQPCPHCGLPMIASTPAAGHGVIHHITSDQLQKMREFAEALDRLALVGEQLAMPAAFHLRRVDHELADMSLRMKALCVTIQGQDADEGTRHG